MHGPGDAQHRLYSYLRRMDDGRPAILLDETQAVWRWARGYCRGRRATRSPSRSSSEESAGRIFHVACSIGLEEAEWIRPYRATWSDGRARRRRCRRRSFRVALRVDVDFRQHYDLDTSRIREELGYAEVVDERTALERTIEWERANPPDEFEADYAAEDAALASRG